MSKKADWIWMPHHGHLIVGHQCRFHLTTYVGKYVVSTVGEWWPDRISREIHAKIYNPEWYAENVHLKGDTFDAAYMKEFGFENIGADTKYETMVFEAEPDEENRCCPWTMKTPDNIDSDRYNDAAAAAAGHMAMCEEWANHD